MEGDMNCEGINGGNAEPREGLCDELQRTQVDACVVSYREHIQRLEENFEI